MQIKNAMRMLVLPCFVLCLAGLVQSKPVEPALPAGSAGQSSEAGAEARLPSADSGSALAHLLKWDAVAKDYDAKPGETHAHFVFTVTNISTADVVINDVFPSCGCTTVSMPGRPWRISPGAVGEMRLDVDLAGKTGQLNKTVDVETSQGSIELRLRVRVPDESAMRRVRNQQFAATDRQLVFRGDCAKCHADPLHEKVGRELFAAGCAICHAPAERASMVPDLNANGSRRSAEDWEKWISEGREGSLMPAFSQKHGGPLTDEQIASLVKFLVGQTNPQPIGEAK